MESFDDSPIETAMAELDQKIPYLSQIKLALKSAASGKERITSIFKKTFMKRKLFTEERNPGLSALEEEEDDSYETSMPEVDILRTFSPLIVHRRIHESESDGRLQPTCKTHFGAVLFADISGFTRLANLLSVEQLQCHISKYFTTLFECVEQFGGDILKICGDAIMIMWPLEECAEKSLWTEKAACALTATLCARELLLSCGAYHTYHGDVEICLSLHCGVGVADVPCYWVGRASRWEFLISGDALTQISSTEPEAKSGEVVISPQTYELVKDHLGATLTPKGNYLLTVEILRTRLKKDTTSIASAFNASMEIDDSTDGPRCVAILEPILGLSDHPTLDFDKNRRVAMSFLGKYQKTDPASLPLLMQHRKMGRGLKYFVHRSARPRLVQMDHSSEFEMAELRDVVTLFVNITGLDEDFRLQKLDTVQKVMSAIVESHSTFGGTLRQFVVDDKGCVAIGALGVPHHTFEDNCVRAVNIANLFRQKIQKMGKNCSIGISKGSTFCGLVGSSNRREYAMMGSSVNLAARLMGSCPMGGIIVDERVRAIACESLTFTDMGTITAKGYADPVPIFAYQQAAGEATGTGSESFGDKLVIGRKEQLVTLRLAVKDFADGTKGCEHQFHFLEGEEGIGKSLIARQVAAESKYRGLRVVSVTGSESNSSTSYSLLSNILDQVMNSNKKKEISSGKEETSPSPLSSFKESTEQSVTPATPSTPLSPLSPLSPNLNDYINRARRSFPDRFSGADLDKLVNPKTHRFKEWIAELMVPPPIEEPTSTSTSTSTSSVANLTPTSTTGVSVSARDNARMNLSVIHGYPVMDLVHVVKEVFQEEIDSNWMTASSRPTLTPRMHQLLLKTLIMRALQAAFAEGVVLIVDNLQWCDLPSAIALTDFISSADYGFGVLCYRSTIATRENEIQVFSTLRRVCYCIPLPPLKGIEVSELVYHIVSAQHHSAVTKEKISRILIRTQGNPGLIEILVIAFRDELNRGLNPNIEDIRTPGQQSVVQKFDALDANLQLLLKTAATIGNVFSVAALRKVYDTLALTAMLTSQLSPSEREKERSSSMVSTSTSNTTSATTSVTNSVRAKSFSCSSGGQSRASAASEMYQRNNFEADISKLVELGLFSPHIFHRIEPYTWPTNTVKDKVSSIEKRERGKEVRSKVFMTECMDTPEIGIHSMTWHDARGVLRRGWAAVEDAKDHERESSKEPELITAHIPDRGSTDSKEPLHRDHQYYKFSHPSIQSTAYSLSLQLDRVPVHAATILYLSTKFNQSPGVEETCLYHAMHLKDMREILSWSFKCAASTKGSMRHKLFVRRATQLVPFLTRLESSADLDLEEQIFATLDSHRQKFGNSLPPTTFPYSFQQRQLPTWNEENDWEHHNGNWLLSIGCIMRDLITAMVKIGEYRTVLSLYVSSERLLGGLITRQHGVSPAVHFAKDGRYTALEAIPEITAHNQPDTVSSPRCIRHPLEALELDSDSDSGSRSGIKGEDRLPSVTKEWKTPSSIVASGASNTSVAYSESDLCGERSIAVDKDAAYNSALSPSLSPSLVRTAPPTPITDISKYSLPSLAPINEKEHILTSHILAYVRGQESLAVWNILRGDSVLALIFLEDIVSVVRHSCHTVCAVLNVICLPRVLALMSLCNPLSQTPSATTTSPPSPSLPSSSPSSSSISSSFFSPFLSSTTPSSLFPTPPPPPTHVHAHEHTSSSVKCMADARQWLTKSREVHISENVKRFYESIQPHLPGLRLSHRPDSGEWIVLTVEAVTRCGIGEWPQAAKCFKEAQSELKEVNDKLSLYHVRMLEAWALFVTGDLLNLHNKMRAITQHSRQSEERLISCSSSMLLAIRFSLSGFYDAAETLINKLSGAGTPITSPPSTPRPSGGTFTRTASGLFSGVSGMSGINQRHSIFIRITEAFISSRRNPRDVPLGDIIILCTKLAARTHCTYIGGIYLFLAALSGLAVYESTLSYEGRAERSGVVNDSSGLYVETDCLSDITDFAATDTVEIEGTLDSLLQCIDALLCSLEVLSMKHTVLLYLALAGRARLCRAKGNIEDALAVCLTINTPPLSDPHSQSDSHPATTLPLGVAYLKMESALCNCDVRNDVIAFQAAEESLKLFSLYEASVEIAILKSCLSDLQKR